MYRFCSGQKGRVKKSNIVLLSVKEGCGNQSKNEKIKSKKVFPVNLSSQIVNLDLIVTQ
jgi:hypothetical protein